MMERVRDVAEALSDDAREWCVGRSRLVRLPLLAWGAWILANHLRSEDYQSLFGGLNLGLHELGHLLFMPFGQFLGFAGGTIAEAMAPLIGVVVFLRQRDYFGISTCLLWEGTVLIGIARYLGDARERSLMLVSPFGGEPMHDWHYLLGRMGLLSWDASLASLVALTGYVSMACFLVSGTWLLLQMRPKRSPHQMSS